MNDKRSALADAPATIGEISNLIDKAISKLGVRKENDLCRYLPMTSGGYMHHFTLRKLKHSDPKVLTDMIQNFIIKPERPKTVPPKQRAPRGSRKRREFQALTKQQLDKVIQLARSTGDKEIIALFSQRRSLAAAKRELIAAVRREHVEEELWNSYVEAVQAAKNEQVRD